MAASSSSARASTENVDEAEEDVRFASWMRLANLDSDPSPADRAEERQIVCQPSSKSKKPKGSHAFRHVLKALTEEQDEVVEEQEQAVHTIADARMVRQQKLALQCQEQEPFSIPVLAIGSDFQQHIVKTLQACVAKRAAKDEEDVENARFVANYLLQTKRHVMNNSAEAKGQVGQKGSVDARNLPDRMQQTACFVLHLSGYLMGAVLFKLECLLKSKECSPVLLCIRRAYDETPSKIKVSFERDGEKETDAKSTAKILQSQCELMLIFKHEQSKQFCTLQTRIPTWLQAMDRTTAEVTKKCQEDILEKIPHLPEISTHFPMVASLVSTDRYSANMKAEQHRTLVQPKEVTSHYTCDIHKLHSVTKKMLAFVDGHVSAMIAASIALSDAGATRSMRNALREVLKDKVHVCLGSPPTDAYIVNYKNAVLDAFLPAPPVWTPETLKSKAKLRLGKQRMILNFFLNDDLQEQSEICFWTPRWDLTKETVIQNMNKYLVPALLPSKPPMFSRAKWTGFEECVQYWGLLACCHNLLEAVVHTVLGPSPSETLAAFVGMPIEDNQHVPVADGAGPEANATEGDEQDMNTVTGNIDWKTLKLQMKQKLKVWSHTSPAAALVAMSISLAHVSKLMRSFLKRSGKEWERLQKSKVALGQPRSFSVLEAYRQTDLNTFFAGVSKEFGVFLLAMPVSARTQNNQVLVFRMLSTSACAAQFYVGTSWNAYPVRLFGSLDGQHHVVHDPGCMLCPLSKMVLDTFPTERELNSEEAKVVLTGLASLFKMDIAEVESRHASTRRITTIHSVQASCPHLNSIGAEWVLRGNALAREDLLLGTVS